MTKENKTINTDITIIGAGIVGLTAAIALAKNGHKIDVLADTDLTSNPKKSNSALNVRSIALSLSSKMILQHFKCWNDLSRLSQTINDIQVSSKGHWGVTRLNNKQQKCDALGYVIESQYLESSLLQKAQSLSNISFHSLSQYKDVSTTDKAVSVSFTKDKKAHSINCQLCLICDGAQSKARDMLEFPTQTHDYQQIAIAAHVSGPNMRNNIAYERFTTEGPLAMLPLTDARYGLVWSCSQQRSKQLNAMNDDQFLQQLQKVFGYRLGKITKIGQRFSFPLIKKTCNQLVKDRCVVLGNSAHNLHPVAGQSLNLALRDIAHLSDLIDNFESINDSLQQYQDLRLKDHAQVIQLGDSLVNLFSNNLPILNHARSAALALLDITPYLKDDFAWRGMGFAQDAASAQRG